jgi:acyl carrier protein
MKIDINQEVLKILEEHFDINPSTVSHTSRLREDLDLDSIDLCDMMSVIEKHTGVTAELSDFMHAQTIGDFIQVLQRVVTQTPAA